MTKRSTEEPRRRKAQRGRKDYDIHRIAEVIGNEDIVGPSRAKDQTVTVKHKSSGKELVISKAAAKKYKSLGYGETK